LDTTGTITSFSSKPQTRFDIGGDSYEVQDAGNSYSLTNPDPQTLRFEVQPGDKAWYDAADGEADDRSEIGADQTIPAGTPINMSYQFMVEPNGPNGSFINTASDWFVAGQMHNDDNSLPFSNVSTSPPFAIQLDGDHLQVVARYCPTGLNPSNSAGNLTMLTLWTDPNPIQAGVYNNIQVQADFSNTGSGYLDVSINGNQVVNYHGPLGYGTGTSWEYGIYRASAPETTAVDYRNMMLTYGSAATTPASTAPTTPTTPVSTDPTTPASTAPTTPVSTDPTMPASTDPTTSTTPVSTDPTTPASTAPTTPTTPVSTDPTTPASTAPTTPTTPASTDPTTPASTPDSAHWFGHHPGFAPVATTLSDAGASNSAATPNGGTAADPVGNAGAKSFALFNQTMAGDFDGDSHFASAAMASSSGSPQQSSNSLTRPLH
jgi:hypothetical protein